MARNFRDGLPWSASLEWLSPAIVPDLRKNSGHRLPTWIQPEQPPMLPDFKLWDRLIRGVPEADQSPPSWIPHIVPLPNPGPAPFPNPAPLPQPRPPAREVDPPGDGSVVTESSDPVGGLLGLLEDAMRDAGRSRARLQLSRRVEPTQTMLTQSVQPVRRLIRM